MMLIREKTRNQKNKSRKRYDQFCNTDIFKTNQDEEYDQLSSSSSEEERIYQTADNERLILKEEEPIDNKEFYLNENDGVPYDYFSALNLNDINTNLNSKHINTSANFDDLCILL